MSRYHSGPIVSVIITAYNYGQYINDAIESVLEQTYQGIEVMVVDDGSTDNTAEVVRAYGDKVSYFYKKNGGISSARNYAIDRCSGEFAVFLDADDKLKPTFVQEALNLLMQQDESVGFVYTQLQRFEAENEKSNYPEYNVSALKWQNYISACILVRIAVLKKYKYDEVITLFEDWDFYLTLAEDNVRGVLLNKPLLMYRKHRGGDSLLSSTTTRRKVDGAHLLRRKHWRMYGIMRTIIHELWYTGYKHHLYGSYDKKRAK